MKEIRAVESQEKATIEFASALSNAVAPFLAVVTAGDEEDFLYAVLSARVRGRRVLTDGEGARQVAFIANDLFVSVPSIETTRGLTIDLELMLTSGSGPLTILPYETVRRHIDARAQRLRRDLEIFAGYPPPIELLFEVVVDELNALLTEIARRGHRAVVMHDLAGIVPLGSIPEAAFWHEPAGPALALDGTEQRPAFSCGGAEAAAIPADDDLVLDQAQFLSETDPATLRRMQPILAVPAFRPVADYWRAQLARFHDDPSDGKAARIAAETLSRAFGAIAPEDPSNGPRSTTRHGRGRSRPTRRW